MKKFYFSLVLIFLLFSSQTVLAQTDTLAPVNWIGLPKDTDTSVIKLFPNPAKDNVFVSVLKWDNRFRYTMMLKDSKGRPIKNMVLLQPQQLIPIFSHYGKGSLWIEVWKEKELLGRERLSIQ
jgi:hypothetical protein